MNERLLQFIWQFQYFNKSELSTISGEEVQIIFHGQPNTNQGPDFYDAKIKIDNTTWAGTVELHCRTSDWKKHGHDPDKNYNTVILHVVWEDDKKQNPIPVVELKDRVSKLLLQRYESLMQSVSFIPCEKNFASVPDLNRHSWNERLVAERLLRKAAVIENYLQQNRFHWEETFWWLLARNFGIQVNADAFEAIARSITIKILSRHKQQVVQLEALFLGQAGLLREKFSDDYPRMLQKEYAFFQQKYKLKKTYIEPLFLRMRPGNFPTIRLAQLAMLVHNANHLFAKIKESVSLKDIKKWLDVTANDYWHYHYRFDEVSAYKTKNLGASMINNIIINTVSPVLFSYGNYHGENRYKEISIQWLEETVAEKNVIISGFQKLGTKYKSAFDSQALVEQKNEYCNRKRCLDCGIGTMILKNS